jgi:hypothetical protein
MIEIVSPFIVSYQGNDTEERVIDALALGESLGGAARLYTAAAHYCAFGEVPRGNYKKEFRCYARIPRDGSYEIPVYIAAIAQAYALHGPLYSEGLKIILSMVLKAIKDQWTKKNSTEKIVEILAQTITEQARIHGEVQIAAINGLNHANDNFASLHSRLIDTLPALAEATRSSGRAFVAPVGNTCRSIKQFAASPIEIEIDEAEAQVIRSKQELEIDDMNTFKCLSITEVNRDTGHCICRSKDSTVPLSERSAILV